MLLEVFSAETLRIPCHVKEKSDRILHRLHVTYIENPKTVYTILVCKLHLFPEILYRSDVQPLGITRGTYIIDMVIHTPTAGTLALLSIRKLADIAPVVVGKKDGHIVRNPESLFIQSLDFLVQGPYLRTLACRFSCNILNYLPLVVEYLLHHIDQVLVVRNILVVMSFLSAHRCITVATHTDCNQVFRILGTLDTLTEEAVQHLLVCTVIPSAVLATLACPFLMVPCHRFMVGRTHDYTHLVSSLAVDRIIRIEGPAPHCRPHEVTAKTEDELEHTLIETVITVIRAVCMFHPACKTWSLVIEEDTAVAHCRLAGSI